MLTLRCVLVQTSWVELLEGAVGFRIDHCGLLLVIRMSEWDTWPEALAVGQGLNDNVEGWGKLHSAAGR